MQINIAARHGHLSEETRSRIAAKGEKLPRLFERLTAIEFTVDLEHADAPAVELRVSAEHKHDFVATETAESLLAAVDGKAVLDGGRIDGTAALSQLTARVGDDARNAQLNLDAQQAIDDQVTAERESVSGVNLDEEAANMLRFQQAYQAAAQVIATADTMFQSLLGAVRR